MSVSNETKVVPLDATPPLIRVPRSITSLDFTFPRSFLTGLPTLPHGAPATGKALDPAKSRDGSRQEAGGGRQEEKPQSPLA